MRTLKLSRLMDKNVIQEEVPTNRLSDNYDMVVVGLGTAGAIAAIVAAREGWKVLGIEQMNCAGGTGTAGAILGYYFGSRGGIFEEIDAEVTRLLQTNKFARSGGVNGDLKKYVLEQKMVESGVNISYETTVTGVYLEGKRVVGLHGHGPQGEINVGSRIVIDCTGEAEVSALAGCKFRLGRSSDGLPQPYSNVLEFVDQNGTKRYYTDSGFLDPTDGEEVSRAIIESALMPTHLKTNYSEGPRLLRLASQLGVREGRLIIGEENVTFEDFLRDNTTFEPIFYAYSNLDVHNKDIAFESENHQDWVIAASLWGINFSVPIPLGALIPKGYEGILVAGRCLAVDHDMAACVRMKRDMQKCGEAAAVAASIALQEGIPIQNIAYETLAARLTATGCLDERNNVYFQRPDGNQSPDQGRQWITDQQIIRQELGSVKPGIAIWSAYRLGEKINPDLREWVQQEENIHLQRHSAMALALQRDPVAIPILREMVRTRDPFVPQTSRKYNQVRGYASIYLLGKLGDRDIVPDLLTIMQDRDSFHNLSTDIEFIGIDEEYYFQYFSFSLTALFRIGDVHPDMRASIATAVRQIVNSQHLTLLITLKPTRDLPFSMNDMVRRIVQRKLDSWEMNQREDKIG